MLTDTTTPVQRYRLHQAQDYVANCHPLCALCPSFHADGTTSIEVRGGNERECDQVVAQLSVLWGLPRPELTGDKTAYITSGNGLAVWDKHRTGVV